MSLTNILKTWKNYPSILLEKYPDAAQFYTRYGPIHLAEGIATSGLLYYATSDSRMMISGAVLMMGRNIQVMMSYKK